MNRTKFILLQELPIAKAGCEVITDEYGGIYRRFAGTWQIIAKVDPAKLKDYVGKAPQPKQEKGLEGEAFMKSFRDRMGWNDKPSSGFPSFQKQQASAPSETSTNV